jgi:HK97 family phage major capsid protein
MAINAAAVAPGGPGLLHVTGSLATDAAGALTNLDAFSAAIGQLVAAGNDPLSLAVILNPLTWSRLMALKRSADSNKPLVAPAAPGPGTTQRQPLSVLGARVYLTSTMPAAKAVVGAPREWVLVVRDNEVAASEHAMFSTGGIAVRAIRRAQLVVTQPTTLDVVSNLPTT